MIKQLPDGRFLVDVRYPYDVRRTMIFRYEAAAKLAEALMYPNWDTKKSSSAVKKSRKETASR